MKKNISDLQHFYWSNAFFSLPYHFLQDFEWTWEISLKKQKWLKQLHSHFSRLVLKLKQKFKHVEGSKFFGESNSKVFISISTIVYEISNHILSTFEQQKFRLQFFMRLHASSFEISLKDKDIVHFFRLFHYSIDVLHKTDFTFFA